MNRFAQGLTADYLEVGKFFREIPYLPAVLFQPGYIGGHCVMPNIELLKQCRESDFLDAVKNSNEIRRLKLSKQGGTVRGQPPAAHCTEVSEH